MQEMISIQKRNGGHLLGKIFSPITCLRLNDTLGRMLIKFFSLFMAGVIEFCGMEKGCISYHTSVENLGFQITDQFMACFGLRLFRAITV